MKIDARFLQLCLQGYYSSTAKRTLEFELTKITAMARAESED